MRLWPDEIPPLSGRERVKSGIVWLAEGTLLPGRLARLRETIEPHLERRYTGAFSRIVGAVFGTPDEWTARTDDAKPPSGRRSPPMSSKDDSVKKVIKALDKMLERQEQICARLERLEHQASQSVASAPTGAAGESALLTFLDYFRAAEALGEASLGAWIEVCKDESLRGSLRVVQMREGSHARLLEARIKELGGSCNAEIDEERFHSAMKRSGSKKKSDAEKLAAALEDFPDIEAALRPIHAMADSLNDDPETQALLRTIAQDERATLECLTQHCERLAD